MTDLAAWAGRVASPVAAEQALIDDVQQRFGIRHAALVSTGRAGLTLLLRAMRRLAPAGRDEVIVPSYTCYSVAASIVRAGLRPRVVDIAPDTLDFVPGELAATDVTRVLAIIATNLYGLPSDLAGAGRIRPPARRAGHRRRGAGHGGVD